MRKSFHGMLFAAFAFAVSQITHSFRVVGSRLISGAYWLVETLAAPVTLKLNDERWKEAEITFSRRVRHCLSIYSHDTKSTGALCSPSLA